MRVSGGLEEYTFSRDKIEVEATANKQNTPPVFEKMFEDLDIDLTPNRGNGTYHQPFVNYTSSKANDLENDSIIMKFVGLKKYQKVSVNQNDTFSL